MPHSRPSPLPAEEPATPDDAVIQQIAALTRDLALLHYECAEAERAQDTAEAASIADAITETQEEIAALTADPAVKTQFEAYREEQFALVRRVHDLRRKTDHIEELCAKEHALARQYSTRRPSSYQQERLRSSQQEQRRLQEEIDQALQEDPTLALAYRSWQLREYRRQLQKDHFAITPSRRRLIEEIKDHWTDGQFVLLTGPTGTGKTETLRRAAREFYGAPEVVSGHGNVTVYDLYGKTSLERGMLTDAEFHQWKDRIDRTSSATEKELLLRTFEQAGGVRSGFIPGKLPRAARDGHILLFDEINTVPNETLVRIKADANLRVGEALHIQEDAATAIPIRQGYGLGATANVKSAKHSDRQELSNEVKRLFSDSSLEVDPFSKEELYDLSLATLIDRRGFLPLTKTDASDTLKHLIDAVHDIQEAYLGHPTAFYEKKGRSTGKHAFLQSAVLDAGKLLTILTGFPRASLRGQSFQDYINGKLLAFVRNRTYPEKDRFTLLDIFTTHGFLRDVRDARLLQDSGFTSAEWDQHLAAHPAVLQVPHDEPALLDPLAVAALDPYHQRAISAAEAVEEFLTTPPSATVNTVDTTGIERTLNLSSQYESQLTVLRESAILKKLSSGQEGIDGIDTTFHLVPTLQEIRSALARQPHLKEKVFQGFTRLLLVPFGMSLDDLREKYKETILAVDQAGGLKDNQGNAVLLDRNNPLYTWDQYNNADATGALLYDTQEFSQNHQGKTKADLLSSSPSGFQVLLVEDVTELPPEGQGATIGSRPQLACNRTSKDYLHTLQTDPTYRYETGFHPEAYIALAITRLRENGTVLDKDTYSFLTGAYFPSSDGVPGAFFYPGDHRAGLGRRGPGGRDAVGGARVGVRVL